MNSAQKKSELFCRNVGNLSTDFSLYINVSSALKKGRDPDEIELLLRKSGKDYCDMCQQAISGREVSIERLERWLGGKEKPICQKCRLLKRRRNILIFIITPLIVFLSYLIVRVLT